jgi:hypothetical protein
MADEHLLFGERDQYYSAIHISSVDWAGAATAIELDPGDCNYLITRIGFTVYDAADDFTQTLKMDFFNGKDWETRWLADNYASLANVADRTDTYKIGAKDIVTYMWHYRNGVMLIGSRGEKMKIYPSANIVNCDRFYCGLRYLKFV